MVEGGPQMMPFLERLVLSVQVPLGRGHSAPRPPEMDIEACRSFARATADACEQGSSVDESTWRDLDLDAVFASLDRTVTRPGRLTLYRWLRRPSAPAVLAERLRAVRGFEADPTAAEALGRELAALSDWRDGREVVDLLWDELPEQEAVWPYQLLGFALPASIAAAFWLGGFGVVCLIAAVLNTFMHYRFRIDHDSDVTALRQLGPLLTVAARVGRLNLVGSEERTKELTERTTASEDMPRLVAQLPTGGLQDLLIEYVRIVFLSEPRRVLSLLERVREQREGLRIIFDRLGELDVLRSLAQWRSELPLRCDPELSGPTRIVELQDAVHPLVNEPVANSIRIDGRGVVITGSNMSGKSTFLRTLGVNVLLAQTVCTCTARRANLFPVRVLSSMRLIDDLVSGTSLYMAEAKRLLSLVQAVDGERETLCLCDELLAGTDARDRSVASAAISSYLERHGGLVVVATHDREMAQEFLADWDCYYFSEEIDRSGLVFDFRLRPGLAHSRNAIRILEHLGYPPEILAEVRARRQ